MSTIIEVRGLTKSFNEITAVSNLDFTVNQREVYGFLGQNGAGKSTTIRTLLSLIRPDEGEIKIFGLDLFQHRKEILAKIGAIVEKPDLYKYLTAAENLDFFAVMSGVHLKRKDLMNKLDKVGLAERADSKIKTFSQGMKQRLGIAVALVNDPDLIILDEPMNGLDPQGIAEIRSLILHLSRDLGKTVFISSHLLSEMEQVADSLLIIHKGKKVVEGKMQELLNPESAKVEVETSSGKELADRLRESTWGAKIISINGNKLVLQLRREEVPVFITSIAGMGISIHSVHKKHSLEDYFLSLTTS
jgi:ABC-type multidrug transport system ATPase subunit